MTKRQVYVPCGERGKTYAVPPYMREITDQELRQSHRKCSTCDFWVTVNAPREEGESEPKECEHDLFPRHLQYTPEQFYCAEHSKVKDK